MADPREWPRLCTDAVVRNILSGAQTQDRRPVLSNVRAHGKRMRVDHVSREPHDDGMYWAEPGGWIRVPRVGDRLWMREAWTVFDQFDDGRPPSPEYRATTPNVGALRWRPSIHMPRWACRLVLPITRVWVERIQEISEADARAEGCQSDAQMLAALGHLRGAAACRAVPSSLRNARDEFRALWDRLYPGSWKRNDWVLCVEWSAPEIRRVAA